MFVDKHAIFRIKKFLTHSKASLITQICLDTVYGDILVELYLLLTGRVSASVPRL